MKHLTILLLLTAIFSCTSNQIGSKLYLETWRTGTRIHIDRNCKNYGKTHIVEYVDTADLAKRLAHFDLIPFCPKCVTDDDADRIKTIVKREMNYSNAADKVKNLYKTFIDEGYDMEDEQTFRKNLQDPTKRRAAYDALVNDGYDMEPFSEFETNIGFGMQ